MQTSNVPIGSPFSMGHWKLLGSRETYYFIYHWKGRFHQSYLFLNSADNLDMVMEYILRYKLVSNSQMFIYHKQITFNICCWTPIFLASLTKMKHFFNNSIIFPPKTLTSIINHNGNIFFYKNWGQSSSNNH